MHLIGLIIITTGFSFAVNSSFLGYGASISAYGETFRRNRQFERNLPIYKEIVALTEREKIKRYNGNYKGVIYSTEISPVFCIAFPLRGILDNWEGVVYDPTGEIMQAKGFDKNDKFYAPDEITKLFGGDLVNCRHIQGNYYRCWFT